MPCPSFHPAINRAFVLLALFWSLSLGAQAKRLEMVDYGFVQVWNFCPEGTPSINGTAKGGEIKKETPFVTNLSPFSVSGRYSWLAPGNYTFEFATADGKKVAVPVKMKLEKMHWFTIILSLNEKGELVTETVEDTYDFKSAQTGTIVFYNAIPEWNYRVGIAGVKNPAPLPLRQRIEVENIPVKDAKISLFMKLRANMDEVEVPVPLDFRASKKIAFIPVKEVDGQLSMRLVTLGYNAIEFTSTDEFYTSQGATPPPSPTPSASPSPAP